MIKPLVLCDPGLLVPPAKDDVVSGISFWPRLVEWAADRRVRLGPASQQYLTTMFAEMGWPDFEPPACPSSLKRNATQALNTLLSQVVSPSCTLTKDAPTLDPPYSGPVEAGSSVGRDAAALHDNGLVGLATNTAHWHRTSDTVRFNPPPPELLPFILEPRQRLAEERDIAVSLALSGRQIKIIGGLFSQNLIQTLEARFLVEAEQVEWRVADKNQNVNLDLLTGLQSSVDVVFCVTGHIGHDTWEATRRQCRRRGVKLHEVRRVNEIADHLSHQYGDVGI